MELDDDTSELSLIRQAHATLKDEEGDNVSNIKQKTWKLGLIINLAKEKGYITHGMKAWAMHNFGRSHTWAYECLNAYNTRMKFDEALSYHQKRNDGWRPSKDTGPRFQKELIRAYENRGKDTPTKIVQPVKWQEIARRQMIINTVLRARTLILDEENSHLAAHNEQLLDELADLNHDPDEASENGLAFRFREAVRDEYMGEVHRFATAAGYTERQIERMDNDIFDRAVNRTMTPDDDEP